MRDFKVLVRQSRRRIRHLAPRFRFRATRPACLPSQNNLNPVANIIKHFTIITYDSRVIIWAIFKSYDSRVINYDVKVLYKIDRTSCWFPPHRNGWHTITIAGEQCDKIWRNSPHFGKYLKIFGNIFKVILVFGKLVCHWANFLCWKWPNIENTIWSSRHAGSLPPDFFARILIPGKFSDFFHLSLSILPSQDPQKRSPKVNLPDLEKAPDVWCRK